MSCPPDRRHGPMSEQKTELGKFEVLVFSPPALAKEERESADRPHGKLVCRDEGPGKGVEGDSKLVEDAERDRDNGFARRELNEFATVAGEYLDASALPVDSLDWTGKFDASASLAGFDCEELGEAVIAFADAEEFVRVDFFFGMLLDSEGMDADLAVVGGIEALHVLDDLFPLFRGELVDRRVICEGEVRAFPLFKSAQELVDFSLLVAFLELAVAMAVTCAIELVCFEASFVDEVPELRWVAVDELGSEFEDLALFAEGADTAAYAIARLEHEHLPACLGKAARRGKAGHARTDDQNAIPCRVHLQVGCDGIAEVI
jgi:hypothetical protein